MTEQEHSDCLHLERKVDRAFFEAGKALMELRDRRLYRSTHRTFEEYCHDRFGYTRIAAAAVIDNLLTNGLQNSEISQDERQVFPTNERQVRPLVALEPQQQVEAWQSAVEEAGGKVPSGRIVKNTVQRIMERTQVPNTYQIGEVCQILTKDNPNLRGKAGCWAIVTAVNDFSCTVKTWDGELTVGLQHLKSSNYLPAECEQMLLICDRILRLRESENLEEVARNVLKYLGELKRPYLTAFEDELLSFLEEKIKLDV